MYRLVRLDSGTDDFGVYCTFMLGAIGTPLVCRGTMQECRTWIRENARTGLGR